MTPTTPTPPDMPELKPCERVTMWRAWRELNAIRARDGVPYTHMGYKCSVDEEYFSSVVDDLQACLGEYAQPWEPPPVYTRPTPPADALPTEGERPRHKCGLNISERAPRRSQALQWASKAGATSPEEAAAIKKTYDELRNPPAPVTDAQREALDALERLANTRMELSLEEWCEISGAIRAALSAPVAQVDVEKLKREIIAEWNAVLEADPQYKFHRPSPAQTIAIAIHYLCVKGHLTPKTQSEE